MTSNTLIQVLGLLLLTLAGCLLWSPWALVIGGGLLLVGPELIRLRLPAR